MPYKDPIKRAEYIHKYKQRYRVENREKLSEQDRAWVAANPDKVKAKQRKYYLRHAKEMIERAKRYYEAHTNLRKKYNQEYRLKNIEKEKERDKINKQNNRERYRAYAKDRRAQKNGSSAKVTAQEWEEIKSRYDYKCLCCGRSNVSLTQDHVVPLKMKGEHTANNIQPLCQSCNSKKSTKIIDYRLPVNRPTIEEVEAVLLTLKEDTK